MIEFSFVVGLVLTIACAWKFNEWFLAASERWLDAYMSANPDVEWVRRYNAHLERIKDRADFRRRHNAHIARIKRRKDFTK